MFIHMYLVTKLTTKHNSYKITLPKYQVKVYLWQVEIYKQNIDPTSSVGQS